MVEQNHEFFDLSGIHSPRKQVELLTAKQFHLLEGMSAINLRILNSVSRAMHVSRGVEMLHEGDTPHGLYFVGNGKLSIARQIGGQLRILAYLHPGDVYGEFGALRRKSRYASVFTTEPSRIIRVDLMAVQQVLEADSNFKSHLMQLLSYRMLDSLFFTHPVFKNLPDDVRTALARELPTHFTKRGERIFSQGEAPKGIYIILSGEVEIRYLNRARVEVLLEIRRDADMLGELARNHGQSLAYSAVAASDLDMLKLNNEAMRILEKRHPATFKVLGTCIDKRARHTIQRLQDNRV